MAPLQLAVYWRLSLIFVSTAFLFFLDLFCVSKSRPCAPGLWGVNASLTSTLASFTGPQVGNESAWDPEGEQAVCDDSVLLSYGQTMYMTGLLLGSLFGGALSDRYGKRVVLLASVSVHAICGLLPALLHQAIFFLAVRCFTGVACCCINICSFSLGVEWSLPRYRVWPPAFLCFSFSLGSMALAPIAYWAHTWTQLHLALGIPQIVCLPFYIGIPESPRWLLLKGRTSVLQGYRTKSLADKAYLDLLVATDWNVQLKAGEVGQEAHTPAGGHMSALKHLRSPTIMVRLGVMSYIGFASALTYYGICLNIGSFGVDIYLAQFFNGLTEAPSLLVPLLLARCGRRQFSMLTLFLSGVACILSLVVSRYYDLPAVELTLALVAKFCMLTIVFITMLYGIELFPTVIRQKCVAFVNLCYRVGCILNTLVSASGGIPLAAMIVYSSGPIIGSGLCLLLPETSGLPLPDSLEDCERQPRFRLPSLGIICQRRRTADTPMSKTPMFLREKDPMWSNSKEVAINCSMDTPCVHAHTHNPATDTQTSHTDTHNPATATQTPHTDTHDPATDTHNPATDTHDPATDTHNPATDTYNSATDTQTPHTDTHTLSSDTQTSHTDTHDPATDTQTPHTDTHTLSSDTGLDRA